MNCLVETESAEILKETVARICPEAKMVAIAREEGKITIDNVRALKKKFSLKETTKTAVLITQAEQLTTPAQNAFLKLLEEPPANVCFMLASKSARNLLPTIVSRCALIKTGKSASPVEQIKDFEKKAELFLQAISTPRLAIAYKNKIKKELKDYQQAREYFSLWTLLLRDAILLQTGNQQNLLYPQGREKITSLFASAPLEKLLKTIKLGISVGNWLETKSVGGDRAGGVLLSQVAILCINNNT